MSQAAQNGIDDGGEQELPDITWVGEQHRMAGYCGRAEVTTPPAATQRQEPPRAPADALRPVAVVRRTKRSQGRVVRIGPPRQHESEGREAA